MSRITILVLSLGMVGTANADTLAGNAKCMEVKIGAPCEIEWDLTAASLARDSQIKVQKFDGSSGVWTEVDSQRRYGGKGQRLGSLSPGKLYRVASCADGQECQSSNVVWATDWTPVEDMPDVVTYEFDGEVRNSSVTKSGREEPHPMGAVMAQYNMYMLEKELAGFLKSDADMPPMSKLSERPKTDEETIHLNVYEIYEATRTAVLTRRQAK